MSGVTVSTFMGDVTTIFGSAMTMVGDLFDTVADNAILLTFVAIPLVGLGVGLVKRLLSL